MRQVLKVELRSVAAESAARWAGDGDTFVDTPPRITVDVKFVSDTAVDTLHIIREGDRLACWADLEKLDREAVRLIFAKLANEVEILPGGPGLRGLL